MLRQELKTDPNGKIWPDSQLNMYIQQAIRKLEADGNHRWQIEQVGQTDISLSEGVAEYALPSNFDEMDFVMVGNLRLTPTTFEEATVINPQNVQGAPYWYYLRGNSIGFAPPPNESGTATLYYYLASAPLTSDGQAIAYPNDFALALVKYGAYLAWSSPRGNYDTAQAKMNDYKELLSTLKMNYILRDRNSMYYRLPRPNYQPWQPNVLYR